MKRSTFQALCERLRPHLQKRHSRFRKPVSVEQRVAVCIWRLATNAEHRTISDLFGIGQSTAVTVVNHVASMIVKHMMPSVIKRPSDAELKTIIQGFRDRWGFPQCAGAIDGTHIGILAPFESPGDYYNRKGFYSIILQGVVDHRLRFWDITVGWPGKVHDARVFANSSLFECGQSGTLFPNSAERFGDVDVPVVILGDAAYPLLSWVMKPCAVNNITPAQATFNHRLSRARMTVERAFGRLKGRWRCLLKRYDGHVSKINTIVAACCVLHNFCEDHREEYEDNHRDNERAESNGPNVEHQTSSNIRDALCEYFNSFV